jgi:hypothetical protein
MVEKSFLKTKLSLAVDGVSAVARGEAVRIETALSSEVDLTTAGRTPGHVRRPLLPGRSSVFGEARQRQHSKPHHHRYSFVAKCLNRMDARRQ